MKKIFTVLFLAILAFTITGCGSDDKSAKTQTVTSTDATVTLDFPSIWKETELHPDAVMERANTPKEQYLIIITDEKEDFADDFELKDFTEILRTNMSGSVEGSEVTEAKSTKIGDNKSALEFYVTGTVDKIKVKYLVVTVENKDKFYQIVTWSLQTRFNDAEPVYRDILESVKFK